MPPTQQIRLWNSMREAQALANELQSPSVAVAAHGLERAYRELYGSHVPEPAPTTPEQDRREGLGEI